MYLYFFPASSIMSGEGYDFCVYFQLAVCIKEVFLNTEQNLSITMMENVSEQKLFLFLTLGIISKLMISLLTCIQDY